MKVRKKQLLLAAGIIWGFAGINILRIGILAYRQNWSVRNALFSLAVFVIFRAMIFGKLVKKHTVRIMNCRILYRIGDSPVFCRSRLYKPLYKSSQYGTAISGSGNSIRRRRQCRQ